MKLEEIKKITKIEKFNILNDFVASSYGVLTLHKNDKIQLHGNHKILKN